MMADVSVTTGADAVREMEDGLRPPATRHAPLDWPFGGAGYEEGGAARARFAQGAGSSGRRDEQEEVEGDGFYEPVADHVELEGEDRDILHQISLRPNLLQTVAHLCTEKMELEHESQTQRLRVELSEMRKAHQAQQEQAKLKLEKAQKEGRQREDSVQNELR